MKHAATALVAACLLAVPAAASAHAEPGTIRVTTAGVDFANPAQVESFRARVNSAIARVCNPTHSFSASLAPDRDCQREVAEKLSPTLTRLIQGSGSRMATVN